MGIATGSNERRSQEFRRAIIYFFPVIKIQEFGGGLIAKMSQIWRCQTFQMSMSVDSEACILVNYYILNSMEMTY